MGENDDGPSGAGAMLFGLTGAVVVDIWAIVDAGHVAKVNNLALRDKNTYCSQSFRMCLGALNPLCNGQINHN